MYIVINSQLVYCRNHFSFVDFVNNKNKLNITNLNQYIFDHVIIVALVLQLDDTAPGETGYRYIRQFLFFVIKKNNGHRHTKFNMCIIIPPCMYENRMLFMQKCSTDI